MKQTLTLFRLLAKAKINPHAMPSNRVKKHCVLKKLQVSFTFQTNEDSSKWKK